jgi:hypothetical protein
LDAEAAAGELATGAAQPGPARRVTWREMAIATAVIGAFWLVLALYDDARAMRRVYWMDEICCTLYPLRDASNLIELFQYVKRYDVAPPLLHFMTWPLTQIFGLEPPVLRIIPVASAFVAFVFLYALLRRRFGRAASAAAVLGVSSHTLILHHAFDARFYAPYLMFGVLFAWMIGVDAGRPSRRRDVGLAVLAICLCTLHWFGVTALFMLCGGALLAHGRRWREGLRLVAPAAAGPFVLAFLLPMMVAQLSQGDDALYWVPRPSVRQTVQFAQLFYIRIPVAVAILLLVIDRLVSSARRHAGPRTSARQQLSDPAVAALFATLFMPFVLAVITVVLEPVMVPRYAILAAAGAAPLIAWSFETIGRTGRVLIMGIYALVTFGFADRELLWAYWFDGTFKEYQKQFAMVRAEHPDVPIVFHTFYDIYPVEGLERQRAYGVVVSVTDSTIHQLYPDTSSLEARRWLVEERRRVMYVDRGFVDLHNRVFGFPRPIAQAQLDTTPRFFFFAADDHLPPAHKNPVRYGKYLFPRHRAEVVSGIITYFHLPDVK